MTRGNAERALGILQMINICEADKAKIEKQMEFNLKLDESSFPMQNSPIKAPSKERWHQYYKDQIDDINMRIDFYLDELKEIGTENEPAKQ